MYDFEVMDKRLIVFGYLFRIANRLQSKMDAQMPELTAKQWFVLLTLGLFDGPPTLKQLAAMSDSSHQNTKQLVLKLQEKGFVTIAKDGKDSRAMRIIATEKIARWDTENQGMANRFVDTMFAGLSGDQVAQLCGWLLKLFDNLGNIAGGNNHE